MRHRDTHETVFLCSFWLEKIKTNRTYVHKSRYVSTLYVINDRRDHRNPTKKHCFKSNNVIA